MALPLLKINDLHVSVEGKPILHGVSLDLQEGELHAIMGPNGSGKSTLVQTLMGHPKFEVTKGTATFRGKDLLTLKPDERARLGLFLAFQYPREISGVSLRSFLFAAYSAQMGARGTAAYNAQTAARGSDVKSRGDHVALREGALRAGQTEKLSPIKFKKLLEEAMRELKIDPSFAERSVNQGFSGGEKKKAEILQLKVLCPLLALLDETDSGLDIDALKIVADGINSMRSGFAPSELRRDEHRFSAMLVTHYARILSYITTDRVHVMVSGKIVESGGTELAHTLEKSGYAKYGLDEKSGKALPTIALEQ